MPKPHPVLLVLLGLAAPAAGFAAHRGLEKIEIHPVSLPGDPAGIARALEARPEIVSTAWDAETGTFIATVMDSVEIELREVRDVFLERGVEMDSFVIEIAGARAQNLNYRPYLASPANGFKYFMARSTRQRYLWDYLPKNPWGANVPLRVRATMHWGATDTAGVAAPDSVRILTFDVNRDLSGPNPLEERGKRN